MIPALGSVEPIEAESPLPATRTAFRSRMPLLPARGAGSGRALSPSDEGDGHGDMTAQGSARFMTNRVRTLSASAERSFGRSRPGPETQPWNVSPSIW
jgi:hypothetical protein